MLGECKPNLVEGSGWIPYSSGIEGRWITVLIPLGKGCGSFVVRGDMYRIREENGLILDVEFFGDVDDESDYQAVSFRGDGEEMFRREYKGKDAVFGMEALENVLKAYLSEKEEQEREEKRRHEEEKRRESSRLLEKLQRLVGRDEFTVAELLGSLRNERVSWVSVGFGGNVKVEFEVDGVDGSFVVLGDDSRGLSLCYRNAYSVEVDGEITLPQYDMDDETFSVVKDFVSKWQAYRDAKEAEDERKWKEKRRVRSENAHKRFEEYMGKV